MFKRKMYILVLILVVVFAIGLLDEIRNQKMRHPIGRDTVKSFGDGTYQIQRLSIDKRNELVNLDESQTIINDVEKFRQAHQKVFVIGDGQYVVLTYEEGIIEIYDNLQDIPDNYKKQFEKLLR